MTTHASILTDPGMALYIIINLDIRTIFTSMTRVSPRMYKLITKHKYGLLELCLHRYEVSTASRPHDPRTPILIVNGHHSVALARFISGAISDCIAATPAPVSYYLSSPTMNCGVCGDGPIITEDDAYEDYAIGVRDNSVVTIGKYDPFTDTSLMYSSHFAEYSGDCSLITPPHLRPYTICGYTGKLCIRMRDVVVEFCMESGYMVEATFECETRVLKGRKIDITQRCLDELEPTIRAAISDVIAFMYTDSAHVFTASIELFDKVINYLRGQMTFIEDTLRAEVLARKIGQGLRDNAADK